MYHLSDILEEIYILQIDWNIAELFEIMKNKVHYYVV